MTRDELAAELRAAGIDEPNEYLRFLATADYVLTLLSAAEARGREGALADATEWELDRGAFAFVCSATQRSGIRGAVNRILASRRASQPVVAVELFDERSG